MMFFVEDIQLVKMVSRMGFTGFCGLLLNLAIQYASLYFQCGASLGLNTNYWLFVFI